MDQATPSRRTARHKPGLAIFAGIGSVWVFVLVTLGALTTSIGAGMAFPDWPLSNGSINPEGWLNDIYMFAEHSHRLTGMMMGFITIGMAVWLWRTEERAWLRSLGWWALGIVIFQGILGGQRVTLNAIMVPGFDMSLGQMLRVPHGILAQVYVCILFAIAAGCSKSWIERPVTVSSRVRTLGLICCGLILVQLVVATLMRHNHAGLAIRTFPHSTPDGGWLPVTWNFGVAVHFTHRVMAVIIAVALMMFTSTVRRDRGASMAMRVAASMILSLVVLQILLGMQIIVTLRKADVTTSHVVVGALLLATTFWLTWVAHRNRIEGASPAERTAAEFGPAGGFPVPRA